MKKILYGKNKNVIHNNLRLYRIQNGLSQSDLAAKMQTMNVNIDQQMISKIERNMRIVTEYELACFCLALGVDIKDMLSEFYDNISV